jgi:hypothetical protein
MLNLWVEKHLYDSSALRGMAEQWRQLAGDLAAARLAHGDLQHGNVLVDHETQTIKLLDYDAAFVPRLAGLPKREVGHPSYQRSQSTAAETSGLMMDRFPLLVIFAALRSLAVAPELWYRLDNGDNLLFRREDFEDPENSRAFSLLKTALLRAPEVARIIQALQSACSSPLSPVPPLDRF